MSDLSLSKKKYNYKGNYKSGDKITFKLTSAQIELLDLVLIDLEFVVPYKNSGIKYNRICDVVKIEFL